MQEFTSGKLTFRAGRLDARKQFHIARRLASLLGELGSLADLQGAVSRKDEASLLVLAGALGRALASLRDEDADYILDACLDVVEVRQDGGAGWARLRANGVTMYELDLAQLMTVAARVIQSNMAGFMAALPGLGSLAGGAEPATSGSR